MNERIAEEVLTEMLKMYDITFEVFTSARTSHQLYPCNLLTDW